MGQDGKGDIVWKCFGRAVKFIIHIFWKGISAMQNANKFGLILSWSRLQCRHHHVTLPAVHMLCLNQNILNYVYLLDTQNTIYYKSVRETSQGQEGEINWYKISS